MTWVRELAVTIRVLHLRHLIGDDSEQDDLLLQDLVVREMALEDERHALGVGRQEAARGASSQTRFVAMLLWLSVLGGSRLARLGEPR